MSVWTPRRFWTEARVVPVEGGFTVQLDGRVVRTPQKSLLVLPTEALAREVTVEWQAVASKVDPAAMPFTRTANSAIDKVVPQYDAVADMLAEYGGSDLICYRAEGPPELVARQSQGWDPLIDWSSVEFSAPLVITQGVMHQAQPETSLAAFAAAVHDLTAFQLAAFHDLVALSGSLVIALAVARGRLAADEAWRLSRIDETWQAEAWGEDDEASEVAALKYAAFIQADRFFALCR